MNSLKKHESVSYKWRYIWGAVAVSCFLVFAFGLYYFLWEFNPLVSDEEMIAHFRAHRAEFEELVRRYREYPRPPDKDHSFWYREGDTPELMRRAGVARLARLIPAWFPNPYSVEASKRFREAITSGTARKLGLFNKYGTIGISPVSQKSPLIQGNSNQYHLITPLRGAIWKTYAHIPEIPRIEDGELLWPLTIVGKGAPLTYYKEIDGVPVSQIRKRVLPSLNKFPEQWRDYECVYRQIETQWFIRMCNGH
ncbi:MAG: hypothetical protein ABIK92_13540 [Pseudomonadota bacterium]